MSSSFLAAAFRRTEDALRSPPAVGALLVGNRAIIHGLSARADLNGAEVTLLSFIPANGGRWAVRTTLTAEGVRVRPANLRACPGLFGRGLPDALICEALTHCDVPTNRTVAKVCQSLRRLSTQVLASGAYHQKLDFTTLARWRASRSVYGFVSLDRCQNHHPLPRVAGSVSCRGDLVAHTSTRGSAHVWDTEQGKVRATFAPLPFESQRSTVAEARIDELALSPGGAWLAASFRRLGASIGPTQPCVAVYDARGADTQQVEWRQGDGWQGEEGRAPLLRMETEWEVVALGWVASTRFVALSRSHPRDHAAVEPLDATLVASHSPCATRLRLYEIAPSASDGLTWVHAQARVVCETEVAEGALPNAEFVPSSACLEALATHDGREVAIAADARATMHTWSFCRGCGQDSAQLVTSFASGHVASAAAGRLWMPTVSAMAFSSSGRLLVSAGSQDFAIRVHRISDDLKTADPFCSMNYRDAIATRPWFTGWQPRADATNNVDELEDEEVRHGAAPLADGVKHLLESIAMGGERMVVSGHRKGCLCVWELGCSPRMADESGGGVDGTARLIATLPPPDAHPPTLTASDEKIRGVAVVGTHGVGIAGPALVYANRAGALTKLCTIDSRELSEMTEREWELYEKDQPGALSELYRGAPWAADGGEEETDEQQQATPPPA